MSKVLCVDCGNYFDDSQDSCPNCGCPKSSCVSASKPNNVESAVTNSSKYDIAQYVYECGVLFYDTFTNRFCSFSGRASRRELWSFVIMFWFVVPILAAPFYITLFLAPIYFIAGILPLIGVWVRRMHDVNKSGWWSICPVVVTFLGLKRSDEGVNDYGNPMDYSNILK